MIFFSAILFAVLWGSATGTSMGIVNTFLFAVTFEAFFHAYGFMKNG
jgi:hypothetical protein